jgi:hypothetical protein
MTSQMIKNNGLDSGDTDLLKYAAQDFLDQGMRTESTRFSTELPLQSMAGFGD